jgi:hypothetical protein
MERAEEHPSEEAKKEAEKYWREFRKDRGRLFGSVVSLPLVYALGFTLGRFENTRPLAEKISDGTVNIGRGIGALIADGLFTIQKFSQK